MCYSNFKSSETEQSTNDERRTTATTRLDLDLAPSGDLIKERAVKISRNIVLKTNYIHADTSRNGTGGFDYAALTFERTSQKDSKLFKFHIPFSCASKLKLALDFLIKENLFFFQNNESFNPDQKVDLNM